MNRKVNCKMISTHLTTGRDDMFGLNKIEKIESVYFSAFIVAMVLLFAGVVFGPLFAEQAFQTQTVFQSPEEALTALVGTVRQKICKRYSPFLALKARM